jgi:hypothetical protein
MWAFTGANFELPVVHKVGDALLPGATASEAATTFESLPAKEGTRDITVEQAAAAALRYEGGGRIVNASLPAKADRTASYSFCIDKGSTGGAALQGREAGAYHRAGLAVLQAAAVVQAGLDVAGELAGHRPAERATHLGYVVASLIIVPIALGAAPPTERRGPWDAAIAAVACVAMLVVVLRLRVTWAAAAP